MKRWTGLGTALALIFATASLLLVAAPASAETIVLDCNGTCGYYEVHDNNLQAGARCLYQNSGSFPLTAIKVRPPLMHGNYPNKTRVGWAFRIQRQSNGGGPWSTITKGPLQAAFADDSIPAYEGHGFTWQISKAPSNPAGFFYRVRIVMHWWHNGALEGTAIAQDDYYRSVRGGVNRLDMDYCLPSY